MHHRLSIYAAIVAIAAAACGGSADKARTADVRSAATPPAAASSPSTPTAVATSPSTPTRAELGIAHVAGSYSPRPGTDPFLLKGAGDIQLIGASTIKVYLTPDYREKYAGEWPATIRNLTELAKTSAFSQLFHQSFQTFVITTYAFCSGTGDPWRNEENPQRLRAEEDEIQELAEYLLTTYAGTGKTFILQNWEGDWSLLGGTDPRLPIPADRVGRMAEWLNVRQAGVARARERAQAAGVTVLNAVEINLVLDSETEGVRRVINSVLPQIHPDALSYSAWESLDVRGARSTSEATATVNAKLRAAIAIIRRHFSGPVYLGEAGFAENELSSSGSVDITALIETVLSVADELGLTYVIYWQVYDNECAGSSAHCRGFWLIKPNGDLSGAGQYLKNLNWAARPSVT